MPVERGREGTLEHRPTNGSSRRRRRRAVAALGGLLILAALLAIALPGGHGPPGRLCIPDDFARHGAGFEIRENSVGGPELREGWLVFVPAGQAQQFHLHFTGDDDSTRPGRLLAWLRSLVRAHDCFRYEGTGEERRQGGDAWLEFERRGSGCMR